MLNMWRSEDNFHESVLSFCLVGSEDQLSVPGVATNSLPTEPSCQPHNKRLRNIYLYCFSVLLHLGFQFGLVFCLFCFVLCGTDQLVTTLLPQPPVCQN